MVSQEIVDIITLPYILKKGLEDGLQYHINNENYEKCVEIVAAIKEMDDFINKK